MAGIISPIDQQFGGVMQAFDYAAPESVEEVVKLLASKNGDARILAGGTDLLVQLREGRRKAGLIIDVKNIPELTEITYNTNDGLRIGAAASCTDICNSPDVKQYYPGLVDGIGLIGLCDPAIGPFRPVRQQPQGAGSRPD